MNFIRVCILLLVIGMAASCDNRSENSSKEPMGPVTALVSKQFETELHESFQRFVKGLIKQLQTSGENEEMVLGVANCVFECDGKKYLWQGKMFYRHKAEGGYIVITDDRLGEMSKVYMDCVRGKTVLAKEDLAPFLELLNSEISK